MPWRYPDWLHTPYRTSTTTQLVHPLSVIIKDDNATSGKSPEKGYSSLNIHAENTRRGGRTIFYLGTLNRMEITLSSRLIQAALLDTRFQPALVLPA